MVGGGSLRRWLAWCVEQSEEHGGCAGHEWGAKYLKR
jgi:hypothetical protein